MDSRLHRLHELWGDLSAWAAVAFWVAVLAGAVAAVEGPRWLYVSLVIATSGISVWILLSLARLYWHDFLAWLVSSKPNTQIKPGQRRLPTDQPWKGRVIA